jgi:CubicO group peptidase (beta-lactamase class C family)
MRILVAGRWIWVVGVVVVLSGCTGGSAPADGDRGTGGDPPAAGGPPTVSVSPSTDLVGDGPVLDIAALPFAEPSDAALPAPRRQALQQALDETVRDSTRMPGVTAAVLSPVRGWVGAAGVDGAGTPLVPEMVTDIGSVTKTFTAAEVLLLADQHRLDLDAPASTYLQHPLLARGPTVRQLLSHTSGIPDIFTPDLVDAIDTDPTRSRTAGQVLAYVTDPLKPPGPPVMSYSNSNYLLLGLLIERVTGLTYAGAVRRDLLPGLGERITVQDAEPPVPPVAAPNLAGTTTGPDGRFLPNRAWASVAGAAGGITADAATLARWGYRLYGGQILPAAATVDLSTPVAPGYGLGTEILEQRWAPNGGVIGHHGGLPGYATVLLVNPRRQLAIAVLVPGDPGPTIDALAKRLLTLMRA